MTFVGMFTEAYHPIVNGVVASIDALAAGLRDDDVDVVTFAPRARAHDDRDDRVVRFASLPLPTSSGYRLCVPSLPARDFSRVRALHVVHAHSPFVTGWYAAYHAKRLRVPFVYTYHTQFDAYAHYAPFDARVTRAAMIALTRTFANLADCVIAPTHAMRERLRAMGVRARIEVVPSAIDANRFALPSRGAAMRARLGGADARALLLVVARLGREKNIELAIDAMALLDAGTHLAIVGDGPHRAALEERIAARGLGDRVRLAGAIAPAAMPRVYAAADAFVFTSLTDTQGLVLAEAQAARLPVVAVDSAVAREMLGPQARFVANDAAALAAGLAAPALAPGAIDPRVTLGAHAAAVRKIYDSLR